MLTFMMDSNAIDRIVCDDAFQKKVINDIESGKITLYITHIQRDEIKDTPDSKAEKRSKLLNFVDTHCIRIPTMGVICGEAACFKDGQNIEAIGNGKLKMIHDALIAATSKTKADYLVTEDHKLKNRIKEKLPVIQLLSNNEFYHLLMSARTEP